MSLSGLATCGFKAPEGLYCVVAEISCMLCCRKGEKVPNTPLNVRFL